MPGEVAVVAATGRDGVFALWKVEGRLGFCQPILPVLYCSPRGGGVAPILLLADIEVKLHD
eukprot:scaffold62071_cov56-Attheya_sp.AAC.1